MTKLLDPFTFVNTQFGLHIGDGISTLSELMVTIMIRCLHRGQRYDSCFHSICNTSIAWQRLSL